MGFQGNLQIPRSLRGDYLLDFKIYLEFVLNSPHPRISMWHIPYFFYSIFFCQLVIPFPKVSRAMYLQSDWNVNTLSFFSLKVWKKRFKVKKKKKKATESISSHLVKARKMTNKTLLENKNAIKKDVVCFTKVNFKQQWTQLNKHFKQHWLQLFNNAQCFLTAPLKCIISQKGKRKLN